MVIQKTPTKIDKIVSLRIGQHQENAATQIKMDVSDWIAVHPTAGFHILFKRPGEVQAQPVLSSLEEGILTWTVQAWETALIGVGYAEVRAIEAESALVAKSRVIPCSIEESVAEDGDVPPAYSGWVEQVLAAADTIETTQEDYEETVASLEQAIADGIEDIQAEGQTQVGNVNTAGTTQVGAVQAKGTEVLNSIPADYTALSGEVTGLKSAIDSLDGVVNGAPILVPVAKQKSDFSGISFYISRSTGKAQSFVANVSMIGELDGCVKFKATANNNYPAIIAFLSSNVFEHNVEAPLVGGLPTLVSIGETLEVSVPEGANYVYIQNIDTDGHNIYPASVYYYVYSPGSNGLVGDVEEIKTDISNMSLGSLKDVNLSNVTNNQTLIYDSSTQKWKNADNVDSSLIEQIEEMSNMEIDSFDKLGTFENGYFINMSGSETAQSSWKSSGYIEVKQGMHFVGSMYGVCDYVASISFYNSSKNILSSKTITPEGSQYSGKTVSFDFTIDSETKYIRISRSRESYGSSDTIAMTYSDYQGGLANFINGQITNDKKKQFKPAHFSFDDVHFCMEDITTNANTYDSIFENPFFNLLKTLHEKYGVLFSLYLFTENIENYTNAFADEFTKNADWLKFGIHANNQTGGGNYATTTAEQAKADYDDFVTNIIRIAGTKDVIDRCVRLGNFKGNLNSVLAMRDTSCGIKGALSSYAASSESYYFTQDQNAYILNHGKLIDYTNQLTFFKTSMPPFEAYAYSTAIQEYEALSNANAQDYLIMFVHEYGIYNSSYELVQSMATTMDTACAHAIEKGYTFVYPMYYI